MPYIYLSLEHTFVFIVLFLFVFIKGHTFEASWVCTMMLLDVYFPEITITGVWKTKEKMDRIMDGMGDGHIFKAKSHTFQKMSNFHLSRQKCQDLQVP